MDSIWLKHDIFVSSDSLCLLFGLNYLLLLLLLLLSRFSRVRLCATPEMAAHQAPPSLGFSRQEHWSGLHRGVIKATELRELRDPRTWH